MRRLLPLLIVCALLTASGVTQAHPPRPAADETVGIIDYAYDPDTITIQVGDQITWFNVGFDHHTVTSDVGVWDSGPIPTGNSFSQYFDTPGIFSYHCDINQWMQGVVVVEEPEPEPEPEYPLYLPLIRRSSSG